MEILSLIREKAEPLRIVSQRLLSKIQLKTRSSFASRVRFYFVRIQTIISVSFRFAKVK